MAVESPEKIFCLERKKFARSHHSFKSKKGSEPRATNSLHKPKRDICSMSFQNYDGNDRIRRMKKESKKLISPQAKLEPFIKKTKNNMLLEPEHPPTQTLMKVRSRKLVHQNFGKHTKENARAWRDRP